jgi:hypothetical protein
MGVADTGDPAAPMWGACWPPWKTCSCTLTSEALSRLPEPVSRKILGVGEEVMVRVSSGPATWTVTGEGKLLDKGDTWAKVAAGEGAGKGPEEFTVTATLSSYSCSLTFTVVEPIAKMRQQIDTKVRHIKGRPTCGFVADMFLLPAGVSFHKLTVREADSTGQATGFYSPWQGTGHRRPRGSTGPEVSVSPPSGATRGLGSQVNFGGDDIWSGDPRGEAGGPITPGDIEYPFSFEYRVGSSTAWHPMRSLGNQIFEVDANNICHAHKAGVHVQAALDEDDSGYT